MPPDPLTALWFRQLDITRRAVGTLLDWSGVGAHETSYRYAAEMPGAKLRAYQGKGARRGVTILILPAPFKRPYVWDLLPAASAIGQFEGRDSPVYLLEWSEPNAGEANYGLADFADRVPLSAMDAIAGETGRKRVVLAGHSLGGTFAAICAALHPSKVAGLLLLETPLSFAGTGPLAFAAASAPCQIILHIVGSPVPGSALNFMSCVAAPNAFYWHPMTDLLTAAGDADALAIHMAARRWTLDEFAMPGRLFTEVVEWLYREDRLMIGRLRLGGRSVDLGAIRAPALAVVNPKGTVVPPQSTLNGLALMEGTKRVLEYPGEPGTVLEHVGALIGPRAHAQLWPRIMDWVEAIV
jgi:polyhydroxyalkanoate synthase